MIMIGRRVQIGLLLMAAMAALLGTVFIPAVLSQVTVYEAVRARLESLESGESRFRELVIRLRHGVSGNYDEANLLLVRMGGDLAALDREVGGDERLAPLLVQYRAAIREREAHWNDFKQHNAVIRNSLRYFQTDAVGFVARLPVDPVGSTLHGELLALNNALFLGALGEGGDMGEKALATLDRLRPLAATLPQALRLEFGRLSRHAEVIVHNGPALEADLQGLIHGGGRESLARLAEANHVLLLAEQTRAGRYRTILLAGVVILVMALATLAARYLESLRQRAKDLALAGTVFESSQQGIVVTDRQGNIIRANPAYCRMSGYTASELVGQNPRILKSGLQDSAFYREMWHTLTSTGRWQGELRNRRKTGEHYVEWINVDAVQAQPSSMGQAGDTLYVGIASDISELVETRERLASLAYYDTLTGLPNRVLFHDRLRQALAQTRRGGGSLALIFADLDNFKAVNDTLGHAAGDELLMIVGERLKGCVRESDTVARLGGDEFAIILMDAKGPQEMARLAGNIVSALGAPGRVMGYEVASGVSLGITFFPDDGETPEELLKNADVAMYRAKERGRNNYQFFTGDMASSVAEALRIEHGLRHALESGELSLHYQPQISPHSGRVVGAEALLRWDSAELGRVTPSRFIPVAEKSGLITDLGCFALKTALSQCAQWRRQLDAGLRVSVNLSAAQFRHEGLAERIAALLAEYGLPGAALELEITESVVMDNVEHGQEILKGLKGLGCRIAIDDFGTGYSSLAYLKRFPVDVLKIDKSFIDGLGSDADDTAVAQAVVSLARSLRLEVVAEGVETGLQLRCLTELAGDEGFLAQGYLFARPLPVAEFEAAYAGFLTRSGQDLAVSAES